MLRSGVVINARCSTVLIGGGHNLQISGFVIIVLSVWMLVDPTFYVSMAQHESDYYSGVCILFLGGALLFVVGFLGCIGAFKESQRLLVLVSFHQ